MDSKLRNLERSQNRKDYLKESLRANTISYEVLLLSAYSGDTDACEILEVLPARSFEFLAEKLWNTQHQKELLDKTSKCLKSKPKKGARHLYWPLIDSYRETPWNQRGFGDFKNDIRHCKKRLSRARWSDLFKAIKEIGKLS